MVPNFAFKLNLHVQVDLRYNLCIHVIDSLWLTNIFLFSARPGLTNSVETFGGAKQIFSALRTLLQLRMRHDILGK